MFIQIQISYANCLDRLKRHQESHDIKRNLELIINDIDNHYTRSVFLNNLGYSNDKMGRKYRAFSNYQ